MSTPKTMRLVKAVKERHPELSLRQIRNLIAAGSVTVNGEVARERACVATSDEIMFPGTTAAALAPNPDANCRLIRKTRNFIFLEKSAGVHSVAHDFDETNSVANWLLSVDPALAVLDPLECGLAHRLDFETSGVMVAARNSDAMSRLRLQFRNRTISKEYSCLVTDAPPRPGVYEAHAGKHPRSAKKVKITARGTDKSAILTEILGTHRHAGHWMVRLRLITGYRHQLRAHLAFLKCPILGDKSYGGETAERLMLHAERLAFADENGTFDVSAPAPF